MTFLKNLQLVIQVHTLRTLYYELMREEANLALRRPFIHRDSLREAKADVEDFENVSKNKYAIIKIRARRNEGLKLYQSYVYEITTTRGAFINLVTLYKVYLFSFYSDIQEITKTDEPWTYIQRIKCDLKDFELYRDALLLVIDCSKANYVKFPKEFEEAIKKTTPYSFNSLDELKNFLEKLTTTATKVDFLMPYGCWIRLYSDIF